MRPTEQGQRLVRRAWRSAQRLGAELDVLYVARPGSPPQGEERERLGAIGRLATELGSTLQVEENDDVVDAVERFVAERGSTYVFIGESGPRRGVTRLAEPLPQRLMNRIPGIDVRIVADSHANEPR